MALGAGLEVTEFTEPAAFAAFADRWDRVVAKSGAPNAFMTADWLQAWWTYFGSGRGLWLLVIAPRQGEPVGVAPMMVTPHRAGGVRLRVLGFVGADAPTCADHLEVASLPGWEHEVADAVGRHLLRHSRRWDVADWIGVPGASVSMAGVADLVERSGRRSLRVPSPPCPHLPLEPPWDAYEQHLQRKFRDIRKYLAAVERRGGRFVLVRTERELGRILGELRRLSLLRVRSKGAVPGLERDDLFGFVTEIGGRFLRRGWLRLYALEADGAVIGTNLNFAYGAKVYGYMSGFDPTWNRHGVGTVMMRHVIRCSLEEGLQEYDFLRGDEDYKYRWTSRQRSATTLRVVNHPLRYWAFTGGRLTARACSSLLERLRRRNGSSGSADLRAARPAPERVEA